MAAARGPQPPPQESHPSPARGALSLAVAAVLAAEALACSPSLPLPRVSLTPTPAADLLAQRTGALLLLPTPGGPMRPGRSDLLDQRVHGRPLVQGLRAAGDPRAPAAELRAWATNPALRAALACEQGRVPTETPEDVAAGLASLSVREVVLDLPSVREAPSYEECVTTSFGAWRHEDLGELRRWWAP
jgi:hypothetical protein